MQQIMTALFLDGRVSLVLDVANRRPAFTQKDDEPAEPLATLSLQF